MQDLKLGHYMKIPPRSLFVVQLVGVGLLHRHAMVAMMSSSTRASIIWGIIGPLRMFGRLGLYAKMNYSFLSGTLAPVPFWELARTFPSSVWTLWLRLVNMPVLLGRHGDDAPLASPSTTSSTPTVQGMVVATQLRALHGP
jgi:hypothetical protein